MHEETGDLSFFGIGYEINRSVINGFDININISVLMDVSKFLFGLISRGFDLDIG